MTTQANRNTCSTTDTNCWSATTY